MAILRHIGSNILLLCLARLCQSSGTNVSMCGESSLPFREGGEWSSAVADSCVICSGCRFQRDDVIHCETDRDLENVVRNRTEGYRIICPSKVHHSEIPQPGGVPRRCKKCSRHVQSSCVSPESGASSPPSIPPAADLEPNSERISVWTGVCAVLVVYFIGMLGVFYLMIPRKRSHHTEKNRDQNLNRAENVSPGQPRQEGEAQEQVASPPAVEPEVRRELPRLILLNGVHDDDPGAYMRSLHCDEMARIFRKAATPMLQTHVTRGDLSEEAAAALLERHVTVTRDLADDWMGRWQRGVSDSLSLSDVWVTLLSMRKTALLQEVQGHALRVRRVA